MKLVVEDDATNPSTAITDANKLISDHVAVIMDQTVLDSTFASAVQAAKIPVVGGLFTSEPFFTNPDFYPAGETNDSIVAAIAAVAKEAGGTNLGTFYCAEAPVCQQTVPALKAVASSQGLTEVYNASVSATASNYTAQCVAAQQAHVKALFVADTSIVLQRIGQDCTRQGYNPIYLTEGTGYSGLYLTSAGIKKNSWTPYPDLPIYDNAGPVKAMNAVVDKYYPGLRNNAKNYTETVAQTWAGALLIADALKNSGVGSTTAPTAADITMGLNAVNGDTLGGWSPPLTFTAGKPHPVDCWFTGRIQNGVAKVVNGGKLSCEGTSGSSSSPSSS